MSLAATPGLVATVEVVPSTIHAAANAQLEVRAIARTADGVPLVDPGPVAWSGATFTDAAAMRTVVSLPAAGPVTLTATIASKIGKAEVIIAPSAATEDNVTVPHAARQPVAAVLLDANEAAASADIGAAAANCREDLLYRIAGIATLGRNLTSGCSNSVAIYAVGRAVRFECQLDVTDPDPNCKTDIKSMWTNGADAVSRTVLPNPLNVDLVVWLRTTIPQPAAGLEATADANYATDIYKQQRAAMTFNIRSGVGGPGGYSGAFVASDGQCTGAETQLAFNPVSAAINVVYVDEILFGESAAIRGLACDRPGGIPVVIVSWKRKVPSTLAHEIAHVMALSARILNTDWRGGHTTYLTTFDETNLMWAQENAAVGLERDHLSLGQAFRIHVDARSWVNVSGSLASGLTIRTGDKQVCQAERHTSTPCPQLHLDVRAP